MSYLGKWCVMSLELGIGWHAGHVTSEGEEQGVTAIGIMLPVGLVVCTPEGVIA